MRIRYALAMSAALLLTVSNSSPDDLNKCVDSKGHITYTDRPCPSGQNESVVIKGAKAAETAATVPPSPQASPVDPTTAAATTAETTTAETTTAEATTAEATHEAPATEATVEAEYFAPISAATEAGFAGDWDEQTIAQVSGVKSVQDLVDLVGSLSSITLIGIFLLPLVLAFFLGAIHGEGQGDKAPWKFFYSALVYLVSVPGIFASVLCAYALFFTNQSLLEVNAFIYFVPIVAMIGTLVIIGYKSTLSNIPGVDRLSAFMLILVISMSFALFIQKMRILVLFHGSFMTLVVVAIGCFILLKISLYFLFRKSADDEDSKQAT